MSNVTSTLRRTARLHVPAVAQGEEPVEPRRRWVGWLVAGVGLPALVALLLPWRSEHALPAVLLVFVLFTVAVALVGGTTPAVTVAVCSFVAVNYFLTPPFHTLVVGTVANLLGLVTFLVVGSVISFLVGQVGRRSVEAAQAQNAAYTAQLTVTLRERELQAEAEQAAVLADVDRLRTALLRAVSHDLRSPLSSIKASVSSLLQDDIAWSDEIGHEFLHTIKTESDRLDHLIANLLDLGRLEAGAVNVSCRSVSFEEVIPSALWTLGVDPSAVDLRVDERSPYAHADPMLLERAVANVVANAVTWSTGGPVEVDAVDVGDRVELRVADHGPGVPADQRAEIFQPFVRSDDTRGGVGAGLGLAVARGFVESMGGAIRAEETPGGGLTMVLSLPGVAT